MITLRPYQERILEEVRDHIRAGRRSVLVQLPTGGGKTATIATMFDRVSKRGIRSAFGVHRRELVQQSIDTFKEVGIKHGVIASGWHPMRAAKVQIASIPTWARRTKRVGDFGFIAWDEVHHLSSKSWSDLHAMYPEAIHIGLTATPERLDGRGLGKYFDAMVTGPSTRELIAQGCLAPYRLLTCPSIMTDGLHKRMGDFAIGELIERANASTLTGDAISHYKQHAAGRRAVMFECSVARSEASAQAFRDAGIAAAHVDGKTPRDERDRLIRDFRRGDIRVLSNVELFGEGFDLPAMEAVILCRPTQSLALYLQQVGRGLRTSPGKADCIILDHAGNYARHGAPDAERTWTLEGRVSEGSGEKSPPMGRQCVWCSAVSPPQRTRCVECGKAFPIKERKVVEIDGELVEVDMTAEEQARHEEIRESMQMFVEKDFDALVQEGRKRGVRNAESYAMWVIEGRRRKRA